MLSSVCSRPSKVLNRCKWGHAYQGGLCCRDLHNDIRSLLRLQLRSNHLWLFLLLWSIDSIVGTISCHISRWSYLGTTTEGGVVTLPRGFGGRWVTMLTNFFVEVVLRLNPTISNWSKNNIVGEKCRNLFNR